MRRVLHARVQRVGGRIGCKLLPDNSISTIHPGSPADRAGLCRGDVVLTVNGSPIGTEENSAVRVLRQETGSRLELTLVRRSGSPCVSTQSNQPGSARKRSRLGSLGSDSSTPPSNNHNAQRRSQTARRGHRAQRAQGAITPESVACGCRSESSPMAADAITTPLSATSTTIVRLEKILRSPAVDLKADALARLKLGDPTVLALLLDMYPPNCSFVQCIFCKEGFVEGAQGTCRVFCDMEWSEEYTPNQTGTMGTICGECRRCGHIAEHILCTGDGAINYPPKVCYEGPHRADMSYQLNMRIASADDALDRSSVDGADGSQGHI